MLIILSKFLSLPFYPIGLVSTLLLFGIILLVVRRYKIGTGLVIAATAVLVILSSPFTAHLMMRALEGRYDPPEIFPAASAIVLLGGSALPPTPPRRYTETNSYGDRVMHAARLFRAGYAPYLIISGGRLPFIRDFPGSEARITAELIKELFEVDSSRIILEELAQNSRDHGPLIDSILATHGLGRDVIVVTSASHMLRSVKVLQKQGLTVYPAPTDFYAESRFEFKPYHFFPRVSALEQTTMALHEIYGMIAYRIMGWI